MIEVYFSDNYNRYIYVARRGDSLRTVHMCFLTGPCTTPLPPRGKAALFSHLQTSDIFKIIQYLVKIYSKKRK